MRIKSYKQMKKEKTEEKMINHRANVIITIIALVPFTASMYLIAELLTK